MKVFIDEDTGARLGRALWEIGEDSWYVGKKKWCRIRPGTPDEIWIPIISGSNRLIISRNIQMLESEVERNLLIGNKAAIVYLPQHVPTMLMLSIVLRKWGWLVDMYENEERPFAYQLTASGTPVRLDLYNYVPPRKTVWPPARRRRARTSGLVLGEPEQSKLPLN